VGQAFLAEEKGGTWGNARQVPGIPALTRRGSEATTIVCASPGNCTLAGVLSDNPAAAVSPGARPQAVTSSDPQVFVADERGGAWGNARKVPGLNTLSSGGESLASLSCASPGNCALAGSYAGSQRHQQAYLAEESAGTWGSAREVPGTAALNKGDAAASSVSCRAARSCTLAGSYTDAGGKQHAFTADEAAGTWRQARPVDLGAAVGDAAAVEVSCASPGNCAVTGDYVDAGNKNQVFIAEEIAGTWPAGKVQALPGVAQLNAGGDASAKAISCARPGDCTAGGDYASQSSTQAYVAEETNGSWASARKLTVTLPPGSGPDSTLTELSALACTSPGNCAASGDYASPALGDQAFIANEASGTWGPASAVPGIIALGHGDLSLGLTISCTPADCVTGGLYSDPRREDHAFLAEQSPATSTALALSAATIRAGHEQAEKLTVTVSPRADGTPTGTVTVKAGSTTLCTITLAGAKGACTLRASQLKAGQYQLFAAYGGSDTYDRSASATHSLTVAK
jgi:hypothetical protein